MKAALFSISLAGLCACGGNESSETTPPTSDAGLDADAGAPLTRLEILRTGVGACVVADNGEVWCWGDNLCGALATPPPWGQVWVPTTSAVSGVAELAVGGSRTCGLWPGGEAFCWGMCAPFALAPLVDHADELSVWLVREGSSVREFRWVDDMDLVDVPGSNAAHVAKKGFCYIDPENALYCWGDNSFGEIGDGTFEERLTPTKALIESVASVSSGSHTCALTLDGRVACWGENEYGEVGIDPEAMDPTREKLVPAPNEIALPEEAVAIDIGASFSCALGVTGGVWCWGGNHSHALGDGSLMHSYVPVRVVDLPPARAIASGSFYTCALVGELDVYCWGAGGTGELGIGCCDDLHPSRPVRVEPNWVREQ